MITEDAKTLDELTEDEYQHLVLLGEELSTCRNLLRTPYGLAIIDAYHEAEFAFLSACDTYNADTSEMILELT